MLGKLINNKQNVVSFEHKQNAFVETHLRTKKVSTQTVALEITWNENLFSISGKNVPALSAGYKK